MRSAPVMQDTRTPAAAKVVNVALPTPEDFRPGIIDFPVGGYTHQFFLATPEARQWYNPPKPHATLEYEWVFENLKLENEAVYDIGSHHGHYALVLAAARPRKLVCVDAVESNCDVTRVNLALNGYTNAKVLQRAISTHDGEVEFTAESNGRVVERGVYRVPSSRLPSIAADATVIKLDIEGEEFKVLPDQIDQLPGVHTWIIEIHPWKTRNPHDLLPLLLERFDVQWLNRATMRVEPYPGETADWSQHTTLFCTKRE